jgi:hypothetical protein
MVIVYELHETSWAPLWGHVTSAVLARRGQNQEGRMLNERAAMVIEPVNHLVERPRSGGLIDLTQLVD